MRQTPTIADLRAWAKGMYPAEAAVELLARAFDGRFAEPGWPWVKEAPGRCWLDTDAIIAETGMLSGGERRVLEVVASLAGDHPLVLNDIMAGIDRHNAALILAALSHASGAHTDVEFLEEPGLGQVRVELGPLAPWPPD